MRKFTFKGVAFVTGVTIIVEAESLGEAVGVLARDERYDVELKTGEIQYSWADLNSGVERKR